MAWLTAITSAWNILKTLIDGFRQIFAYWKEQKRQAFEQELAEVQEKLSKPTTSEEKKDLAKKLSDLTSRL